jgi:hypothetical protein
MKTVSEPLSCLQCGASIVLSTLELDEPDGPTATEGTAGVVFLHDGPEFAGVACVQCAPAALEALAAAAEDDGIDPQGDYWRSRQVALGE